MKHKNSLVLVVDMLNGFINEGLLSDKSINQISDNIEKLLKQYESIFICDEHLEDSLEFKTFPKHCLKDSSEAEIIPQLQPYVKQVVKKNSTNAFHCLDLDLINRYDELMIVGCCSDICVLQLALTLKTYCDQFNFDKEIIVFENCIATYDNDLHPASLYHEVAINLMRNSGISIKTL